MKTTIKSGEMPQNLKKVLGMIESHLYNTIIEDRGEITFDPFEWTDENGVYWVADDIDGKSYAYWEEDDTNAWGFKFNARMELTCGDEESGEEMGVCEVEFDKLEY